jgi:hypothetical protein
MMTVMRQTMPLNHRLALQDLDLSDSHISLSDLAFSISSLMTLRVLVLERIRDNAQGIY